jgi:hypothetical protein
MIDLVIEIAQNGFIVVEGNSRESHLMSKRWAFETPEALSEFILDWAKNNVGDI